MSTQPSSRAIGEVAGGSAASSTILFSLRTTGSELPSPALGSTQQEGATSRRRDSNQLASAFWSALRSERLSLWRVSGILFPRLPACEQSKDTRRCMPRVCTVVTARDCRRRNASVVEADGVRTCDQEDGCSGNGATVQMVDGQRVTRCQRWQRGCSFGSVGLRTSAGSSQRA